MNYDEDDENGYDRQKMRQECTEHYAKMNNNTIQSNVEIIDENTILRTQH